MLNSSFRSILAAGAAAFLLLPVLGGRAHADDSPRPSMGLRGPTPRIERRGAAQAPRVQSARAQVSANPISLPRVARRVRGGGGGRGGGRVSANPIDMPRVVRGWPTATPLPVRGLVRASPLIPLPPPRRHVLHASC